MSEPKSSVNTEEIAHFAKDSAHWWDEDGPFAPLHRMQPVRMSYIKAQICTHFDLDVESLSPFTDLEIIDVGCGGGLICEPLARLGGTVTGLDADTQAIEVAKDHAERGGLNITYENNAAEDVSRQYDIVLALEIIEHVDEIEEFVQTCTKLVKPGGLIIFSTLNRTPKSFALGIVAAEYILRWVPRGTHSWKKFIKPSELTKMVNQSGMKPCDATGIIFDPIKRDFRLSDHDLDVNYFISAARA